MKATLYTDGGARGNPGPAGIGYVLAVGGDVIKHGEYVGVGTNNQAEYKALVAGLRRAQQCGATDVTVFMDSELIVKQMSGAYRVKNEDLKPLYQQAKDLVGGFANVRISHVPRSKNKQADYLVNEALDKNINK